MIVLVEGVADDDDDEAECDGDTVNVASRLEAASEAGRVNISETTLILLGNAMTEERGMLPVKNKAPLRMFFVDQLN